MIYLVALGGNAIHGEEALANLVKAVERLPTGSSLVITHGNGPQVGELSEHQDEPLSILTAQTEAGIGVLIKNAISNLAPRKKMKVMVVLTEVRVSEKDAAFRNPTKPIGKYLGKAEAANYQKRGISVKKLINGFRRVVPSPAPLEILNLDTIKEALKMGNIVIASGGGGIPIVVKKAKRLFADAVIDKDYSSALLARSIHADKLIILTNVDGVYLDYKGKNERLIRKMRADALNKYVKDGAFEEGTILPKIKACMDFAKEEKKPAVIGNLSKIATMERIAGATTILP